jgi:4-hydroxybenzoate polyprenyltransferase
MKLFSAILRLIRWPNLLFIALSQVLFYVCIVLPSMPAVPESGLYHQLTPGLCGLLVLASVLIAAGGYIINDYFDINIDQINKPEKMVVERVIYRRHAMVLHAVVTLAGLALSGWVASRTNWLLLSANLLCALLLWFYSTRFKRELLIGNLLIALLTAWTILVMYVAVNSTRTIFLSPAGEMAAALQRVFKFAVLYGGFAFILSLIREVVKDMEDVEGDARYDCNTIPIAWGIRSAKVFAGVWLAVLLAALLIVLFYVIQLRWWMAAAYCFVCIVVPLVFLSRDFLRASVKSDYTRLSSRIKLIMLSGILSMPVFMLHV